MATDTQTHMGTIFPPGEECFFRRNRLKSPLGKGDILSGGLHKRVQLPGLIGPVDWGAVCFAGN